MVANFDSNLILDENVRWKVSGEALNEAAEDSKTLRAIIDSLLDRVLRSHDTMQQEMEAKEASTISENPHLRHMEE